MNSRLAILIRLRSSEQKFARCEKHFSSRASFAKKSHLLCTAFETGLRERERERERERCRTRTTHMCERTHAPTRTCTHSHTPSEGMCETSISKWEAELKRDRTAPLVNVTLCAWLKKCLSTAQVTLLHTLHTLRIKNTFKAPPSLEHSSQNEWHNMRSSSK